MHFQRQVAPSSDGDDDTSQTGSSNVQEITAELVAVKVCDFIDPYQIIWSERGAWCGVDVDDVTTGSMLWSFHIEVS